MNEDYVVRKHKLSVSLVLVGSPAKVVDLHVGPSAGSHEGAERPSDIVNGTQRFFPVVLAGEVTFVQRDAVLVLSVPTESELGGDLPAEDLAAAHASTQLVAVVLENAMIVKGALVYLLPQAQKRLQDYLNTVPGQFLPLRDGDVTHLVNKHRIVRISQV